MFDNSYIARRKTNNTPVVTFCREYITKRDGNIFTHMHYHDDFEILYIIKGKVKMLINGEMIVSGDDSIFLINPYETHYGEILGESLLYYCIGFDFKFLALGNEADIMTKKTKYINYIPNAGGLKCYISEIHNSYTTAPSGWEIYARANLLMFFYFLNGKTVESIISQKANFEKEVIDFIELNYINNVTSRNVSEELGYNHNYFCRAFKKSFGCCFSDYLNEYRIRRAQELLGTHKVTETAGLVGFSNINYFSVTFKKITGISPSVYKKQNISSF